MIFFNSTDAQGLFFLVRCVDRRYWKYGSEWNINVEVSDRIVDNILPTMYILKSTTTDEEQIKIELESMVENFEYHLNHENFKSHYDLDISEFDLG